MNTYPNTPAIASAPKSPLAAPPIIQEHWVRNDSPNCFAEKAAAAAFGAGWATPSSHGFIDRRPPHIAAPKTVPVVRNPVSAILDRKRRAA